MKPAPLYCNRQWTALRWHLGSPSQPLGGIESIATRSSCSNPATVLLTANGLITMTSSPISIVRSRFDECGLLSVVTREPGMSPLTCSDTRFRWGESVAAGVSLRCPAPTGRPVVMTAAWCRRRGCERS